MPVDGWPERHVTLEGMPLDVVHSFCYFGDETCPGGDCKVATIARTRTAWGKFRELLSLLISTTISLARLEKLYGSSLRGTLLHASECWSLRREEVQRLLRNEGAMLRWMLKIKAEDNVSLSPIYGQLDLALLESKLRSKMVEDGMDMWKEVTNGYAKAIT